MDGYRRSSDYAGSRPSLFRRLGQLVMALIMLGGLVAGLFLVFFRGYVVDGPDGLQLQPPLLKAGSPIAQVGGTVDGITVDDDQSVAKLSPSPEPLQAIYLPLDAISAGSYEKVLQENHCNAVIVDMKDRHGNLGFVSEQPLAIASGASAADPEQNNAIRTMNQEEGLYSIARIACFRDDILIAQHPDLSLLRTFGSPWRDEDGATWLAPALGDVQSYLLDLCREVAALGFDEILLTHCCYPTKGSLDELSDTQYDIEASEAVLEDFCSEVRTLLEAEGVRLSIRWEDSSSEDQSRPLSGQTIQGTLLAADRVWISDTQEHARQTFVSLQRTQNDDTVVTIRSDPGDSETSWAILPQSF